MKESIAASEANIEAAQAEIESTKDEIAKLGVEMENLVASIKTRAEKLDDQARAVQVVGEAGSVINFFLDSDSLSDLISRVDTISVLVGSNQEILQQQKDDQELLKSKQAETVEREQSQSAALARLQDEKAAVDVQRMEQDALIASIKAEKANAEEDLEEALVAYAKAQEAKKAEEARKAAEKAQAEQAQKAAEQSFASGTQVAQAAPSQNAATTLSSAARPAAPAPSYSSAGFVNTAAPGQCTWYAQNRLHAAGISVPGLLGNAGEWAGNAARFGIPVDQTPRAGRAICFPAGVAGAHPVYGHVGIVEQVHADGSITISEMNVQGLYVVSYRTLPASISSSVYYIG